MTLPELKVLLKKITSVYQGFNVTEDVITTWFALLKDVPLNRADSYLTDYMSFETRKYPTPADILERHRSYVANEKATSQGKNWTGIKCFVCMDDGFILYKKTLYDHEYEFIARCNCEAGNRYKYDGRECKNHATNYCTKHIAEILDPQQLAYENAEAWAKANKDKADINELFKQAVAQIGSTQYAI